MYIYWLQVHYHLLDFIQFLEPFIIKFKTGQIQLMNHVMFFFLNNYEQIFIGF